MVKRSLLVVACIFISICKIYCQDPIKTPVQFPSPEASNLGIVNNLPVSLHIGKLDVSIPVSSGDAKNIPPMSLTYNTGGIMPDFHPGWVGLGWSLNAGGVVTRLMNFIPDETEIVGFYYTYNTVNSLNNIAYTSFFGNGGNCWNNICVTADGAADEFFVSAPGLSGKFQIDYKGKFRMLEDPSALIVSEGIDVFDNNWGYIDLAYKPFKGFTVTKNDGTKYRFGYAPGLIETTDEVPRTPDPTLNGYASAWYLAQIIYPSGETVNYSYTPKVLNMTPSGNDRNYFSYLNPNLYQDPPPTDGRSDAHGEAGIGRTNTHHAYLQHIESSLVSIDFNTSTSNELRNGQSDYGNWKRLDNIVITDKLLNRTDKTITFNYDPNPKKRLTLLSVVTKDGNNVALPPYEFTYDPNPLPVYQSGKLDFWGYYNNTNYASMIPSVVWPDASNDFYYSPNREPNIYTIGNGILTQIKYPTGGTTSFEFEPNEFSYYRQFTTANEPVNISTVKWGWDQDYAPPGQPSNYYNTYDGRQKYFYLYTGSAPVVLTRCADAYISGSGISGGGVQMVLPPNTYTHESIQQLLGIPYYIGNAYSIRIKELSPRKKNLGPGLRIKRVVYKSADVIDLVHEFVYAKNFNQPGFDPDLSSGILGNRGAFVLNPTRDGSTGISTITFSTSQSPQILSEGSPLGYSEVVDITKDKDGNMLGYVINKYSNFDTNPDELPTVVSPGALLVAKKNNKFYERGKLLETASYSNSGKVLTKTVNHYFTQSFSISKALTTRPDFIINGGAERYWSALVIRYTDYFGAYLMDYQDQYQYSQQTSDYVQTHTNFYYNTNYFREQIKTITSTGQQVKQTITYPNNFSTPVFGDMVTKNMVVFPIETITYKDDKVTEGELNTYKSVPKGSGTLVVKDSYYKLSLRKPVSSVVSYDGNTIIPEYDNPLLRFTSFDTKGNILETKDRHGITTAYLWGYASQYPVAKVIGSDYNSIKNYIDQNILNNTTGFTDDQVRSELNKIRISLAGTPAQVFTYTYSPLQGITSETNAQGRTTYYEYDRLGRLVIIRDQDRNVIKRFCYNYAGQPSTCYVGGNQP